MQDLSMEEPISCIVTQKEEGFGIFACYLGANRELTVCELERHGQCTFHFGMFYMETRLLENDDSHDVPIFTQKIFAYALLLPSLEKDVEKYALITSH
jgi:hypothetical protein